jgi:large subunit ribosomal protein L29
VKAREIRDLSQDEMTRKLSELKEELFNFRFQHAVGQLENQQKMKMTKRDIARIKTVINESVKRKKIDNTKTDKE